MSEIGHNSKAALGLLVERIEDINGEVRSLAAARRELYKEGEAYGFNTGAVRRLVRYRAIPKDDRTIQDPLLAEYMQMMEMK